MNQMPDTSHSADVPHARLRPGGRPPVGSFR